MEITRFDQEEQREIREIVGGTPIEDMPEVESFTDSDLVPFIKVTGGNASPVRSAAVIKAKSIGGGSGGGDVNGVKGDAEENYRKGNVNITKANIGLGNVENKSASTLSSEIMTSKNVKSALGCQQGGTKYLKEDGSWDTPAGGGGVEQIQSDWNQTNTSAKDYIKNKPTSMPANGGNAATVNNHSVEKDVPSDAVFTDHTYSVMGASGSTHSSGLVPDTPTTAGTSKFLREDGQWAEPQGGGGGGNTADVNYDTNNKKITKTIDGATSDVVTVEKLKTDMNLKKGDVDLGNVGNFKAVSTVENQGLSNTEKSNARTNIGAGTSNFSGNYNDLSNKPTIPVVPTNVSAFTNDAGYLTQHQDISGKADKSDTYTKSEVDSDISQLRSELNAKQLQVGAVPTDSAPEKGSTNRVPSGDLYDTMGELIATHSFSFVEGHSSNNDRLKVSIRKGTVFSIYTQASSTDFYKYEIVQNKHIMPVDYKDMIGKTIHMVAIEDIEYLGFYMYNNTTMQQEIYMEIRVFANKNAKQIMEMLSLSEKATGFSFTFEMPDNNNNTDTQKIFPKLIGHVEKGVPYTLIVDSDTGITYEADGAYPTDECLSISLYESDTPELTYENEKGRRKGTFYAIAPNEPFTRAETLIVPSVSGILAISRFFIKEHESVNVTLVPAILNKVHLDMDRVRVIQQRYYNASKADSTYGDNGFEWYPSFLCVTDVHSAWGALERAFMYAEESCIDNVLLLGDTGESSGNLVSYQARLETVRRGCSKPSFAVPGNHEYTYAPQAGPYYGLTDEQTRGIYYSDAMIAKNGENHPTINGVFKNYYYKDVTKTKAHYNGTEESYTIRVIGLYQFEWNSSTGTDGGGNPINEWKEKPYYTQEQIDWLVSTLKSTPRNVPVIILSHCHISNAKCVGCAFDTEYYLDSTLEIYAYLSNRTFFYSIIDAWVRGVACNVSSNQVMPDGVNHPISVNTTFSGTHKFIANICGHVHEGGILRMLDTSGKESNYYVGMSPSTNDDDFQNSGYFIHKPNNIKFRDCINVYVYDYDHNRLKVARLGSDMNAMGQEAKIYVAQL